MTRPTTTILIVDDELQNRKLLEMLLQAEGYATRSAVDGHDALASVAQQAPDLILLDVMMPGLDGYTVARTLKANAVTAHIPIIMVTAQADREARISGLGAGAEDFLQKPVDRAELHLRVRNLLRLKALGDLLQNQGSLLEQQVLARTADLHQLAHYDPLTGLPNRALFFETLRKTLLMAADMDKTVAVMFLDLDHFKNVNDTLGHATGDELLVQFSERLVNCVRIRDTVGRLGGDEFALILLMEGDELGAAAVASKIDVALRAPFNLKGHEVSVTASIGITVYPDDASDPQTLVKFADTAMYRAKRAGRNTFQFFTSQMNVEVMAKLEMDNALRNAVENDEFVLHYQPRVDLTSGRVTGVEALLRWQRPGHGLVSPASFIPALEESGLIVRVGSWVIAAACRQIALWMQSSIGPIQVSVNVSSRQFIEGDLERDVSNALTVNGVAADLLELELTESSLMLNIERTIATLGNLKKRGVQVSIDDFGTGYSSLAYLRRFPIDKLKIDRAFIRDITNSPDDAAIALTIIRMAHSLKLTVIAEGVETAAQLAYLRHHDCDEIQGFYFSRPLATPELEQLLLDRARLPVSDRSSHSERTTLLLVDEDFDALDDLDELFRQDGYHILRAQTTAEGFEQLAMHRVDLVICDTASPDATDFFERVKGLHPHAMRIVLTGHTNHEAILDAINRGAVQRYYTKPWNDDGLRANIRDASRNHLVARHLDDGALVPRAANLPPTRRATGLDGTGGHITLR